MHDLKLAVNLTGWRIFIRRKEDKAFQSIAKRIYQRDNYACQYCGFQAKEFQEIVNLDGNYSNNKSSNMVTACCFCSQCLFLQMVGIDEMGGGQLIYLPEMSQQDLNSFCHVLFCAMGNNTGYQDSAQTIYRSFKFRSQIIENKLGSGMSNPATLGYMIIDYQNKYPDTTISILQDIRLLPAYTKFKLQLDVWAESALKELAEAEQQTEVTTDDT
jgi:intracellular multiplication protein IcmJ